eukprot:549446-Rhodomonas_salina.1
MSLQNWRHGTRGARYRAHFVDVCKEGRRGDWTGNLAEFRGVEVQVAAEGAVHKLFLVEPGKACSRRTSRIEPEARASRTLRTTGAGEQIWDSAPVQNGLASTPVYTSALLSSRKVIMPQRSELFHEFSVHSLGAAGGGLVATSAQSTARKMRKIVERSLGVIVLSKRS